jgi:hypothetical protein
MIKRTTPLLALIAVFSQLLVFHTSCNPTQKNEYVSQIPSLQEYETENEDSELKKRKNRAWTEQEAQEYAIEFSRVQQSIQAAASISAKGSSSIDVRSLGTWKNRGPYNMPGAFEFCEVDEETDTVYAVTCGHYGGVQFIWKGPLTGDNWTLVNPKNPSRFEDLIVIPTTEAKHGPTLPVFLPASSARL